MVVAVNVAENCTINGEKPAEYGGKKNENKFATHWKFIQRKNDGNGGCGHFRSLKYRMRFSFLFPAISTRMEGASATPQNDLNCIFLPSAQHHFKCHNGTQGERFHFLCDFRTNSKLCLPATFPRLPLTLFLSSNYYFWVNLTEFMLPTVCPPVSFTSACISICRRTAEQDFRSNLGYKLSPKIPSGTFPRCARGKISSNVCLTNLKETI